MVSAPLFELLPLSGVSCTPDWSVERTVTVELDYLTKGIGLTVESDKVVQYLHCMQLPSTLSEDGKSVVVTVPAIRSDILHACDILEDVAIGYGFGRILDAAVTPKTVCRGAQQPIEKLR
jgi:phenylalanyl-tRNA synthetase beta chain